MLGRLTLGHSPAPLKRRSDIETVQRLSMKLANGGFFGMRDADVIPREVIPDHMTEGRQSTVSLCELASLPSGPPGSMPNPAASSSSPCATLTNPPAMLGPTPDMQPTPVGRMSVPWRERPSNVQPQLNFNDLLQRISEEHDREVDTLKKRMIELSLYRKENSYLRKRVAELEATNCNGSGTETKSSSTQGVDAGTSRVSARHTVDGPGIAGHVNLSSSSNAKKKSMGPLKLLPEVAESSTPKAEAAIRYKQEACNHHQEIAQCYSQEDLPAIATNSETDEWQRRQEEMKAAVRTDTKNAVDSSRKASMKKEAAEVPMIAGTSMLSIMSNGNSEAMPAVVNGHDPVDSPAEAMAQCTSTSSEHGQTITVPSSDPGAKKSLLVVGDCFRSSKIGLDGTEMLRIDSCQVGTKGSYRPSVGCDTQATQMRLSTLASDRNFSVLSRWASDSAPFSKSPIRQQRNERLGNYFTKRILQQVHTSESLRVPHSNNLQGDKRWCCSWFIAFPGNKYRMMWDLTGMILIFFDIIMIPLGVFHPPETAFSIFLNWVTLLFWSLDMVSSFFVGYVSKGETVMDFRRICFHYFRTWFLADATVVGIDWVLMSMKDGNSSVGEVGRSLRVLRIMRTFRLLRLLKLKRILAELEDRINSEFVSIMTNIFKLILLLLMASHFIGCAWYFVGDSGLEEVEGRNWIEAQGFLDQSLAYRYTTSLHWSLTQFTPASMAVQPQNAAERTFAIIILVFALVTFSSFLSSITSSMTQLRHMSEDSRKQFWMLRRYMREKGVSKLLALRVQRYLEYATAHQRSQVPESKVKVLSLLSEQLHNELKCAVSMPSLSVHPLMNHISKNWIITTHRLSDAAISKQHLACGDNLFFCGEDATYMFFVVAGQLQYMKVPETGDGCSKATFSPVLATAFSSCSYVGDGDWVSEQVLWTAWVHVGDLQAVTESTMIRLDGKAFGEVICMQLPVWEFARTYAEKFVRMLNNPKHELSDVIADETDYNPQDIMSSIVGTEEAKENHEQHREKSSWLKLSLAHRHTKAKLLRQVSNLANSVYHRGTSRTVPTTSAGSISCPAGQHAEPCFAGIHALASEPGKS